MKKKLNPNLILGLWISLFCLFTSNSFASKLKPLREPSSHLFLTHLIPLSLEGNHSSALALVKDSLGGSEFSHKYFSAYVLLNRFGELADTNALNLAETKLHEIINSKNTTPISPQDSVYLGLAYLQNSYIASIKKKKLSTVFLARKGEKVLSLLPESLEAQSALAVYHYYKAKLLEELDWIPFFEVKKKSPEHILKLWLTGENYLQVYFVSSLIWMYYDLGQYHKGLKHIGELIHRYPNNKLFWQFKADFLYRLKKYSAADSLYRQLEKSYINQSIQYPCSTCLPLGELEAVGNQVKVATTRKDTARLKELHKKWKSPRTKQYLDWLTPSLIKAYPP